jgi:hypothetical protein
MDAQDVFSSSQAKEARVSPPSLDALANAFHPSKMNPLFAQPQLPTQGTEVLNGIEDCGYVMSCTIGHGVYAKVKLARHVRTGKKVCRTPSRLVVLFFSAVCSQDHHQV